MDKNQMVELRDLLQEANDLSAKASHNPSEKMRFAYLQTAIAALRSGASVESVRDLYREEQARRGGVTLPKKDRSLVTAEEEQEVRSYRESFEQRDVEGDGLARIGTYTGLGFFVPNSWYGQVVWALKAHDALLDPEVVTYIKSTTAAPMPIPTPSDVENVASVTGEGGAQSEVDIAEPNHVVLGGFSYKTPRYVASIETMQDVNDGMTVISLFNDFSRDRLARGIGADLAVGNGTNKPLGLVPSLIANGAPVVTAQGAATNDGGAEAGYNSIGSIDLANMIALLDEAYLSSPRCAFMMNRKTLATLEGLLDKNGRPLELVKYVDGYPCIYGIRVRIAPSMDGIGNGSAPKYPVVLGDFSFFGVRIIAGEMSGVRSYTEGPGLAENGLVGLRSYLQADAAVLFQDWGNSAASPFVLLKNSHS